MDRIIGSHSDTWNGGPMGNLEAPLRFFNLAQKREGGTGIGARRRVLLYFAKSKGANMRIQVSKWGNSLAVRRAVMSGSCNSKREWNSTFRLRMAESYCALLRKPIRSMNWFAA